MEDFLVHDGRASPVRWRWDQGRLQYFGFDSIRLIAKSLVALEGASTRRQSGLDALRPVLVRDVGLPFLPADTNYPVWRNYARVFGLALLATSIDGALVVTDMCQTLAGDQAHQWDADRYLAFVIQRTSFPSPVFDGYAAAGREVYPFCAVLRYLVAKQRRDGSGFATLDEIASRVVGNGCAGTEPPDYYEHLADSGYRLTGDEPRQLREMLIFASQASYLKWQGKTLFLDVSTDDSDYAAKITALATPSVRARLGDRAQEVLALGRVAGFRTPAAVASARELPGDISFVEGKRMRVTHLRLERSPKLRRMLLASLTPPILCDMCTCNTGERYPWVDNLLQVHHVLPLSSSIAVTAAGTSLADLKAVCPSCHISVHAYYRNWLDGSNLDDFPTRQAAVEAYHEAKSRIRL
jgi:hypothetical protein